MKHSLPTIHLRPGEADRLLAGHPWVYAPTIQKVTPEIADGDAVQVRDHRRRFLGVGLFNSQSRIRVRLLSRGREVLDADFFRRRIESAHALRRRYMPAATCYRVVNAESDLLSGLIVDRYEDVLVLQTPSLGMDRRKETLCEILHDLFHPHAIYERNDQATRDLEGLDRIHRPLFGEVPDILPVRLNRLTFEARFRQGHKTALYLDQQKNYARVAALAAGRRVLDCFSFAGGFAIHAAAAGAAEVTGVEQSADAVAWAEQNARSNGVGETCRWITANAFDWLKERAAHAADPEQQFDLIILDPPSFTRTRMNLPHALRGYKEIHLRALRLLAPGGVLVTFCCSHHVDASTFLVAIQEAASDAGCLLRRTEVFTQSPDHPILPAIPETEYLKGFAFEIAG